MLSVEPNTLKINPITIPPAKTENMVFQLATPVHNRMMAPSAIAITLVSPIEPGIKPTTISHMVAGVPFTLISSLAPGAAVAACPNIVAPVKPSTTCPPPIPKMLSVLTQTASPDILVG